MPCAHHPNHRAHRLAGALLLLVVAVGTGWVTRSPSTAGAAVVRATGFHAIVLGWTSWYGSYAMGDLGVAWCIDHGSRAPDPAFGYAPVPVDAQRPELRTAMAWALGSHGEAAAADPIRAAALMLVLHDLMGAVYPLGPLDVDVLGPENLAGFGGAEGAVIETARSMKADALARRSLVPPLSLSVDAPAVDPGSPGPVTVRLVDAGGRPVGGAAVEISARGAALDQPGARTGADGTATLEFVAAEGPNHFAATAVVPDLALRAFASTTLAAQRVATPATVALHAETGFDAAPPTTTTEPTTTTAPPETTTTTPPPETTTTTAPPETTTTTAPPETTTTMAAAPPSTAAPAPRAPVPAAPAPPPTATLARTGGAATGGLALVGTGLVAIGAGLVRPRAQVTSGRWPPPTSDPR